MQNLSGKKKTIETYYDEEMWYLNEAGKEFERAHPERARFLNITQLDDRDPYVERLFEGFAFLAGRIREKLDDELPELTESLIGLLSGQDRLDVSVNGNKLFVDDVPVDSKEGLVVNFALDLDQRAIESISFYRGLSQKDYMVFLKAMKQKPRSLNNNRGIDFVLKNFFHVKLGPCCSLILIQSKDVLTFYQRVEQLDDGIGSKSIL